MYLIRIKGASFCQVIRIAKFVQLKPSATPGNQKWNGAAPVFSKRDIKIKEFKEINLVV